MTRQEAFDEINLLQDGYIDELSNLMNDANYESVKHINFTSATGTGKTKMMAKLINKYPDYYFIITTLSKGQLHLQVRKSLEEDCSQKNFTVYGSADYKINSKLDANDIISKIPTGTKCIWLRDEGHIRTNRYDELLADKCYKIINFSATNMHNDIKCNFAQTMMLRTVNQTNGTPEDAIKKLLEVKAAHKAVPHYNPCAIFRCVGGNDILHSRIVELCNEYNLKYIDITEDEYLMSELCEDDNKYDVIINRFKIVEGIDIRRAHILYMDNQPSSNATTIQVIGRCRRNALLYRDDIDILSSENRELLEHTRECYVFYNVIDMKVSTDTEGELQYAFCNHISCEDLKAGTSVEVINGQLPNGLYVIELGNATGKFKIEKDSDTGFNVVSPCPTDFYDTEIKHYGDNYIYFKDAKIRIDNLRKFPLKDEFIARRYLREDDVLHTDPYYEIRRSFEKYNISHVFQKDVIDCFEICGTEFLEELKQFENFNNIEHILDATPSAAFDYSIDSMQHYISSYLNKFHNTRSDSIRLIKDKCALFENISLREICSNTEIIMLQYYCVRKSELCASVSLNDLFGPHGFINDYIYARKKWFKKQNKDLMSNDNIFDKVAYSSLLLNETFPTYEPFDINSFTVTITDGSEVKVVPADILYYFNLFRTKLKNLLDNVPIYVDLNTIIDAICKAINRFQQNLNENIIPRVIFDCNHYFEDITEDDRLRIRDKDVYQYDILLKDIHHHLTCPYDKILNDKESSIIGVDLMHQIKVVSNEFSWTESKAVTSKVGNYNKLNSYLSTKYKDELLQAKEQIFTGKNTFKLDKKCNSVLGYCVEYYSKYLLYGKPYLEGYVREALIEAKVDKINDGIIVRACMLKYKDNMIYCFGKGMAKIIKGIPATKLIQDDYKYFVSLVVKLGTRTAKFAKELLYKDCEPENDIDDNLSINHITAIADYITRDTILDIKVRNNIDDKCVRQVLAYHYLSTKRSDLGIKKVVIYDATSDKAVTIDITPKNIVIGKDYK